jgi:hypothetical protein
MKVGKANMVQGKVGVRIEAKALLVSFPIYSSVPVKSAGNKGRTFVIELEPKIIKGSYLGLPEDEIEKFLSAIRR